MKTNKLAQFKQWIRSIFIGRFYTNDQIEGALNYNEMSKTHELIGNPKAGNSSLCAVRCWVRCLDCKYLNYEVRHGNPDGDIVECMQGSNENIFINGRNIYEKWPCDVFEPCH